MKLKERREEHGNCLVPVSYEVDPQLRIWVVTQRHDRSKLDPARRERLAAWGALGLLGAQPTRSGRKNLQGSKSADSNKEIALSQTDTKMTLSLDDGSQNSV